MDQFSSFLDISASPAEPALSRRGLFLGGAALASGLLVGGAALTQAAPAEAYTDANAWGGFTNGRIPTSHLTALPRGGHLRRDAALALGSFNKAFAKVFGAGASMTQTYRPYSSQLAIWLKRYTSHHKKVANSIYWSGNYWTKNAGVSVAAVPGTSVHGWALAVDFSSGIQTAGSQQKKWADKYGPKYAWYPVGNGFGEPWHFEFHPGGLKK